ncbi:MAG TPA: DNA mismatch repair protein MutS [Candidatus Eremiobacteraeota bacterium]|nr:MAG: DNA mismatch repair protein MutS [bacterium ADurb.Bin363]HPZ08319.1 DNA mismatch repair protein MutS [Candidatus Eremiobacteraeota bacterium]
MLGLTPMLRQYHDIKSQCPGAILFFRVGDFYETYGDDAEISAKELNITLTSKEISNGERIPMAGVPYHAVDPYLCKMIRKGYKVAICEQTEDPKKAKGLVKRDIVRIVTSGTILEDKLLEDKQNNYLLSIIFSSEGQALALADISTGEFRVSFISDKNQSLESLKGEIARLKPAECILSEREENNKELINFIKDLSIITLKKEDYFTFEICKEKLENHFGKNSIAPLLVNPELIQASGGIISYLEETHKLVLNTINRLETYLINDYMVLDHKTRRNLELTYNIRDGKVYGTLLWIMDKTKTSMGGRKLRQWIEQPLMKLKEIKNRLDAVEELYNSFSLREKLREKFKDIRDIERIFMRIVYGTANGRDLIAVKRTLEILPEIKYILSDIKSEYLNKVRSQIKDLEEIKEIIEKGIDDDPPLSIKDGNLIKSRFNKEVDELRAHRYDGKKWIARLESQERERTGIKSLKVRYNKVFGYFIEITRANLHLVPDNYIRKQTLSTGERFITPELKDYEVRVLGAGERLKELEYELFCNIRNQIAAFSDEVLTTADAIAIIDVLSTLAEVAVNNNYVKPEVNRNTKIILKGSRHPVIEEILGRENFVPNDAYLDCSSNRLLILTGPNMAGKSTYLRQVAICVIMSQMGSFIPAQEGHIGMVDRIFTRIGAFDDLVMGQSTFLVEMKEVADIIKNATDKSLIVLDEIGRGTSTYDGLSIAWAVAEYIYEVIKGKTLFTTHFHELTQMAEHFPGVKNYRVAVKEKDDELVFLRKIFPGGTDKSYGVKVAKLAALPDKLLRRAQSILENIEKVEAIIYREEEQVISSQLEFFNALPHPLIDEIRDIDINSLTPVEALLKISELKDRIEKQYV